MGVLGAISGEVCPHGVTSECVIIYQAHEVPGTDITQRHLSHVKPVGCAIHDGTMCYRVCDYMQGVVKEEVKRINEKWEKDQGDVND